MVGEVDEARLERPVALDAAAAGEPPVDVVVRAENRADATERPRLMAFEPAQLGRDQLLIDAVAGPAEEFCLVDLGPQFADFGGGATVALLNARPDDGPVLVEKDERGNHAGHANAPQGFRLRCSGGAEFSQDLPGVPAPL